MSSFDIVGACIFMNCRATSRDVPSDRQDCGAETGVDIVDIDDGGSHSDPPSRPAYISRSCGALSRKVEVLSRNVDTFDVFFDSISDFLCEATYLLIHTKKFNILKAKSLSKILSFLHRRNGKLFIGIIGHFSRSRGDSFVRQQCRVHMVLTREISAINDVTMRHQTGDRHIFPVCKVKNTICIGAVAIRIRRKFSCNDSFCFENTPQDACDPLYGYFRHAAIIHHPAHISSFSSLAIHATCNLFVILPC